jgi:hypothetical protein
MQPCYSRIALENVLTFDERRDATTLRWEILRKRGIKGRIARRGVESGERLGRHRSRGRAHLSHAVKKGARSPGRPCRRQDVG